MRRIVCLLLALLLSLAPAAYGAEESVPPAVEQARQSLVHLYGLGTDPETGRRSRWTGTGFAVGIAGEDSDIFLTNWHVATGGGKYADGQVELWLLSDDARFDSEYRPMDGCAVRCRVLNTTDGYPDVAVIQALEPVQGHKALPLQHSRQAAAGTRVYALGFPGLQATRNGADSGWEDVQIHSGTVADHLVMSQAGRSRAMIHSAAIVPGFSGGPLVNEQGAVVAQNTYGFGQDVSSQLFCAIYIDYGMALLDGMNIPCTSVSGSPPVPQVISWIALPLGAALLLGFALHSIRTSRQRREPQEDAHED